MFRSISAAVVATLSFAAIAAEPTAASGEESTLVAMQTDRAAAPVASATPLDDYAGVYEAANGAIFVVVREGDALTIEMPESVALPIHSAGASFVIDASFVSIEFEYDSGNSARLVLSRESGETVVATRVALPRGTVTIHDI